jgi:hypothetical protein
VFFDYPGPCFPQLPRIIGALLYLQRAQIMQLLTMEFYPSFQIFSLAQCSQIRSNYVLPLGQRPVQTEKIHVRERHLGLGRSVRNKDTVTLLEDTRPRRHKGQGLPTVSPNNTANTVNMNAPPLVLTQTVTGNSLLNFSF